MLDFKLEMKKCEMAYFSMLFLSSISIGCGLDFLPFPFPLPFPTVGVSSSNAMLSFPGKRHRLDRVESKAFKNNNFGKERNTTFYVERKDKIFAEKEKRECLVNTLYSVPNELSIGGPKVKIQRGLLLLYFGKLPKEVKAFSFKKCPQTRFKSRREGGRER